MSEARHDRRRMGFGLPGECALKSGKLTIEIINRVAHIEAKIGRDLVVARACGMKASGGSADQLREPALDIHMNIFERARKGERAGDDLGLHLTEATPNFGRIGFRDDALL